MKHLYFLYFLITLSTGIISLGIATFIYLKTKDAIVRYYLYFYVPFTLVVVFYTAEAYIEANIPTIYPDILLILKYCATTSLLTLIFVVPVSVHYLSSVPYATIRNVIFGGLALLAYMGYQVMEFIITDEKDARPSSTVDRVGYLCFAEIKKGGAIMFGDKILVGGKLMGRLVGFDEYHMPNHLNIILYAENLKSGFDLAISVGQDMLITDKD